MLQWRYECLSIGWFLPADSGHLCQEISLFSKLLLSNGAPYVLWRRVLLGVLVLLMAVSIAFRAIFVLQSEYAINRDLTQDYLMGLAIRRGENPYVSVPRMVERYLARPSTGVYTPPSPHPPVVGLLFVPLSLLSIQHASLVWLLLSVVCGILVARELAVAIPGWRTGYATLAIASLLFLSKAGSGDLLWGQFDFVLLFLLLTVWRYVQGGRNMLAGVLLGCCFSIKFMFLPLAVLMFFKGRGRFMAGFLLSVVLAQMFSVGILGADAVWRYFSEVLPQNSSYWANEPINQSVQSAFVKTLDPPHIIIGGAGIETHRSLTETPVSAAAMAIGLLGSLVLIALTLWRAIKEEQFDSAFARMLIVSLAAHPVCWSHYCLILSLPLAYFIKPLLAGGRVARLVTAKIAVILLLMFVDFGEVFYWLAAQYQAPGLAWMPGLGWQVIWIVPVALMAFLALA